MGFRFRKKIKIAPGISINLNKSIFSSNPKPSITIGGQGLGMNVSKDGVEGYAGAPGTGLSYRKKLSKPETKSASSFSVYFWLIIAIMALSMLMK